MASPSPNFDGFKDAQRRLRQEFGQDLTWITPIDPVWPNGTQINPETGEPYDPTVEPTSSGVTRTIVRASVVTRPIHGRGAIKDEVSKKAIGWMKDEGIVLIVDTEDYHLVRDATEVEYAGDTYTIREDHHDYLGPADRWLFFATL